MRRFGLLGYASACVAVAVLGMVFLARVFWAVLGNFYDSALVQLFLFGAVFLAVGFWGLGIEYSKLNSNVRKPKVAYVEGLFVFILAVLGLLIFYMYFSAYFFPTF